MSSKRSHKQTSPELNAEIQVKKHLSTTALPQKHNSSVIEMSDKFSWSTFDAKLNKALDEKLQAVAKKEDITAITTELQSLRDENAELKAEIQTLKNKLEQVDKVSRRPNLVVRGLKSQTTKEAATEFAAICNDKLNIVASIATTTKVRAGDAYVFTFDTARDSDCVLAARRKLGNTNIFINRDLTDAEREKGYKLRLIARQLANHNPNLNIRTTDFSLFKKTIFASRG